MEAIYARFYPNTTASSTLSVQCLQRPQKGTGNFATAITSLTVVYTTGVAGGAPWSMIVDSIVTYFMDQGFGTLTQPKAGASPEGVLRELFQAYPCPTGTSSTIRIYMDGPEEVYIA